MTAYEISKALAERGEKISMQVVRERAKVLTERGDWETTQGFARGPGGNHRRPVFYYRPKPPECGPGA
jgi:hypothetical protein